MNRTTNTMTTAGRHPPITRHRNDAPHGRSRPSRGLRAVVWIGLLILFGQGLLDRPAEAQDAGPDCNSPLGIVETLPDGGRWEMCWGYHVNEGIFLYHVYYKPKGKPRTQVLGEGWVSQIHVRYDNDEHSFLDVTQYGLGGTNMNALSPADCPGGTLINPAQVDPGYDDKNMICKKIGRREYAFTTKTARQPGWYFDIFSVATVGQYNYIPTWRFFGDGTIELRMGASGKLQEAQRQSTRDHNCADDDPNTPCRRPLPLAPYSWPLDEIDYFGLSHTHNYFWRLDFDVGNGRENDVVEEIEFVPNADGSKRRKIVTQFRREAGRSINPDRMRSWRVRDSNIVNRDGNHVAWHIEPTLNGHNYTGATLEPFNRHDFYVTKYKKCEKYVADNIVPVLDDNENPIGFCPAEVVYPLNRPDAPQNLRTGFVNNESLVGEDIVTYVKVSFHHIPRNEDEPHMHTHWNSIRIVPRNLTTTNPLANANDVDLDIGTRYANNFGHEFGARTFYDKVRTRFVDQGKTMMLEVRGFDADANNEINVRLNGHLVGRIRRTGDNQRARALTRIRLPRSLQVQPDDTGDLNIITFDQDAPHRGTRWGVTDIRVIPDI